MWKIPKTKMNSERVTKAWDMLNVWTIPNSFNIERVTTVWDMLN